MGGLAGRIDETEQLYLEPLKDQGDDIISELERYREGNGHYPASLKEVGLADLDPLIGEWRYYRRDDDDFDLFGGDYEEYLWQVSYSTKGSTPRSWRHSR